MRLFRLRHGVERAAVLEPLDLASVEGVLQLDLESLAILGVHSHGDGLAGLESSAVEVNLRVRTLAPSRGKIQGSFGYPVG